MTLDTLVEKGLLPDTLVRYGIRRLLRRRLAAEDRGDVEANQDALMGWVDQLRASRTRLGASPGALEVFLTLRGVRTMALRLDRAEANARMLVDRLSAHPAVTTVRYPGFGAVISFDLADAAAADRCCEALRVIRAGRQVTRFVGENLPVAVGLNEAVELVERLEFDVAVLGHRLERGL